MNWTVPTLSPTHVRRESFALFAVPAVNLFPHEADPILLDHRATSYLLRPSGPDPAHYQIFSVDSVTGITRSSGRERSYAPFDLLRPDNRDMPVYHTVPRKSPVHAGFNAPSFGSLSPREPSPEEETLSIELTCSNGTLPEGLHVGDVSLLSSGFPDTVSVRNITPVTPGTFPPLEPDLAERFTTHLFLTSLSLASADTLRSLLELYVFSGNRSMASVAANKKRVAGIEEVTAFAVRTVGAGHAPGREGHPGKGAQGPFRRPGRSVPVRLRSRAVHRAVRRTQHLYRCNSRRDPERRWVSMGAPTGPATTPVINDLLERGHEFSFPQALRLACAHLGPDALERNRLRVRPRLSLDFPAADVDTVERPPTADF